jgi:hypothetical protein
VNRLVGKPRQYAVWLVFVLTFGSGYTASMMRFVVALVFIAIAIWLGFSVIPDMVANMLSGTP